MDRVLYPQAGLGCPGASDVDPVQVRAGTETEIGEITPSIRRGHVISTRASVLPFSFLVRFSFLGCVAEHPTNYWKVLACCRQKSDRRAAISVSTCTMHAILTGATGLVGSAALDAMLKSKDVTMITILSRRPVKMAEDAKGTRVRTLTLSVMTRGS